MDSCSYVRKNTFHCVHAVHWQWLNTGWPLCTSVLDPGNMLFGVDPKFSPSWRLWNQMQSWHIYIMPSYCVKLAHMATYNVWLICCLFVCLFVWRSFLLHTDMTFHFNLSLSSPLFSSWSACFRSDGEEPLVKAIHVSSSFVCLHCFLNLHGNIEEKLHQLRVLSAAAKLFVYDALEIQHSWNLGLWMQKVKPSKTPC